MALTDSGTYPASGITTDQLMVLYDALKPQHYAELQKRFGDQYTPFFQELRAMGREEALASDTLIAHEENWIHRTIKVLTATPIGGIAGGIPAAGVDTNIVLDPADHDTLGKSYPRVGDIITIPGTSVQGRIITKTTTDPAAHIIRLSPLRATDTLGAIAAGTTLAITSGSFGGGTGQPTGTTRGTTKRTYHAQIFKESIGFEGQTLIKEPWYKLNGGWYSPAFDAASSLLAMKIDGALTVGQETTNTNMVVPAGEAGAGNPIKTTKGMIPWISELGKTIPVVPGAFDVDILDQIELYLLSQGMRSGYAMAMVGAKLGQDINKAAMTWIDGNGTDYTKIVNSQFASPELAASVNFKALNKGNITMMIKPMPVWSHPQYLGAAGYDFESRGIVVPLSSYKDPKTKMTMQNLAIRYMAMGDYSRRFEVWRSGAAGGNSSSYVGDIDATNTYFRSHLMLQFGMANQGIILEP